MKVVKICKHKMLKNAIETFFKNNFDELPKTIAVAVSGGIDSLALTFLLDEFCRAKKIKLHAITIDHKMRKGSSDEALALAKIFVKNKIAHEILAIDAAKIPAKNIEASLREVRYDLLYGYCTKHKIEHLFLAHHQNDCAENFLIRLFRGSQIDGLSKMKEVSQFKKIKLCRPLLDVKKSDLQKYLQGQKIKWFEDESNLDKKFLRNKIRKFLMNLEESELVQERIVKFSENLGEIKEFEDEILLENAKKCLKFNQKGEFLLNLEEYKKIPTKIAQKILSLVLIEISGNIYKPRFYGLQNFEKEILKLEKGKKKNFYGCMAKIDKNSKNLLIYREENSPQKLTQNFDEKTQIIDGRFLQKKSMNKPYKFYFRTILGRIFDSK